MAGTHKRGIGDDQGSSIVVQNSMGDDGVKRQRKAEDVAAVKSDVVDHGIPGVNGAQHLGSVRICIMETHRCEKSPWSFCYARCSPIKALLAKTASIHALRARAPDSKHGIAIHINGRPAAAFDHESETAFMAAIDAGQIIFDKGVAKNWAEIDFDVLAGPLNESATVPPEVQTCIGFETDVFARDRSCDDVDCSCC